MEASTLILSCPLSQLYLHRQINTERKQMSINEDSARYNQPLAYSAIKPPIDPKCLEAYSNILSLANQAEKMSQEALSRYRNFIASNLKDAFRMIATFESEHISCCCHQQDQVQFLKDYLAGILEDYTAHACSLALGDGKIDISTGSSELDRAKDHLKLGIKTVQEAKLAIGANTSLLNPYMLRLQMLQRKQELSLENVKNELVLLSNLENTLPYDWSDHSPSRNLLLSLQEMLNQFFEDTFGTGLQKSIYDKRSKTNSKSSESPIYAAFDIDLKKVEDWEETNIVSMRQFKLDLLKELWETFVIQKQDTFQKSLKEACILVAADKAYKMTYLGLGVILLTPDNTV